MTPDGDGFEAFPPSIGNIFRTNAVTLVLKRYKK